MLDVVPSKISLIAASLPNKDHGAAPIVAHLFTPVLEQLRAKVAASQDLSRLLLSEKFSQFSQNALNASFELSKVDAINHVYRFLVQNASFNILA